MPTLSVCKGLWEGQRNLVSGKKVVSRKVALEIGAFCIALLIIMGGLVANYVSNLQKQIASEKSEIDSLNSTISSLNASIASMENQFPSLKETANLESSVDGFSVIQITDTQYLSDSDPALFDGLTSWIADNSVALNATMVVHTGDIVNTANSELAWSNANTAMMELYNTGVPYCWDAGNHEQFNNGTIGLGNPNISWLGGNYPAFNVTAMRQLPYWVGDINYGKDTAVKFNYGNYHFMVINIEYNANPTVLNWMQTLLECNPNVNVIVATHDLLNGAGDYGLPFYPPDEAWATNFEKLLNNYPNIFMTINGHSVSTGLAYNKRVGHREEIFFNRQEVDKQTGAATARIYTFNMSNPANPVVNAYTYQTYGIPQYINDPKDQFSFSTNLTSYSPSTVSIATNTNFLEANDHGVSFAKSITLNAFSQNGDALTFNNLTLNGATSSFTVTALSTNIVINNYDSNSINYAVSGSGSQTFSVNESPASVDINGTPTSTGWVYSNGEIAVTGATTSVAINFT